MGLCSQPKSMSKSSWLRHVGGSQIYGLLSGPPNNRCRIVLRTQKGTIILTTTHVPFYSIGEMLSTYFAPTMSTQDLSPSLLLGLATGTCRGRPSRTTFARGAGCLAPIAHIDGDHMCAKCAQNALAGTIRATMDTLLATTPESTRVLAPRSASARNCLQQDTRLVQSSTMKVGILSKMES